jgi:hypothetical protein
LIQNPAPTMSDIEIAAKNSGYAKINETILSEKVEFIWADLKKKITSFGHEKGLLVLGNGRIMNSEKLGEEIFQAIEGAKSLIKRGFSKTTVYETITSNGLDKLKRMSEVVAINRFIQEFNLACTTRRDWSERMTIVQNCLSTNKSCADKLNCVDSNIYSREWDETPIVILTPVTGEVFIGKDKAEAILFAYLDVRNPDSMAVFKQLRHLIDAPGASIKVFLRLPSAKDSLINASLLALTKSGSADKIAPFLTDIFLSAFSNTEPQVIELLQKYSKIQLNEWNSEGTRISAEIADTVEKAGVTRFPTVFIDGKPILGLNLKKLIKWVEITTLKDNNAK